MSEPLLVSKSLSSSNSFPVGCSSTLNVFLWSLTLYPFSKHQTWVVWPIKRWRMKIMFCACGWRINIWTFILDLSISTIWYLRSVSVIFFEWYFVFRFCKIWYFNFPLASTIWYFCSVSIIVLVFRLLFSFCN